MTDSRAHICHVCQCSELVTGTRVFCINSSQCRYGKVLSGSHVEVHADVLLSDSFSIFLVALSVFGSSLVLKGSKLQRHLWYKEQLYCKMWLVAFKLKRFILTVKLFFMLQALEFGPRQAFPPLVASCR